MGINYLLMGLESSEDSSLLFSVVVILVVVLLISSLVAFIKEPRGDIKIQVRSRQAVDNYDDVKFFKESGVRPAEVLRYLDNNKNKDYYKVVVKYTSPAGKKKYSRVINIYYARVMAFRDNPTLLMSKTEYNQYVKSQEKDALELKRKKFYNRINKLIDNVNYHKGKMVIKNREDELDRLVTSLLDKTGNNIQKIKTSSSNEWLIFNNVLTSAEKDVNEILDENKEILDYYNSADFNLIKDTYSSLMSTQKEFNEYIEEKAANISNLFGKCVVRSETNNNDEYNYIRPYKKTITPFTTEVSKTVFASAENNPLEYVIKQFYPIKDNYPEQIQKLHTLIEELETLREAKVIIDNYKREYNEYLVNVPSYILEKDEAGFYSRLGFANVDESALTVEYKFSYTSGGGFAQRTFTVPMTEETILELISRLEKKLTFAAFAKEQRLLMTSKLRQSIKERDNYTCCTCGNSIHVEPNLLLEIDHIIPVARGGITEESNLQTLCWKCNRAKAAKLI